MHILASIYQVGLRSLITPDSLCVFSLCIVAGGANAGQESGQGQSPHPTLHPLQTLFLVPQDLGRGSICAVGVRENPVCWLCDLGQVTSPFLSSVSL